MHDVWVVALCTLMCGGETCTVIALFGQAKREILGFMNPFAEKCQGVVVVDGRTLRRSYDRAEGSSLLHLVSARAAEQRLVLGQLAVEDKSNEITAVPKPLELLSPEGTVATADAMHCQRQVAQQVIDQSADHALALKAN